MANDEMPKPSSVWGSMAQQQLERKYVSRDEINAFLESAVPRTVPKALSYHVLNKKLPLIQFGSIFLCVGICFMFAMVSKGTITGQNDSLSGFSFLCCWNTLATAIIGGTLLYRRRKTRLLREGILVLAKITDVNLTGIKSTCGDHKYLTVEFLSANGVNRIKYETYRESAAIAREYMHRNCQVRMLIDPKDARHVICPELLKPLDELLAQAAEAIRRPYKYRPN